MENSTWSKKTTLHILLLIVFVVVSIVLVIVGQCQIRKSGGSEQSVISRLVGKSRLKYKDGVSKNYLHTLHDGQRKLLLSEIEFLVKYGKRTKTVLYIGASLGRHLLVLHKLFPKHKFILYDLNPVYHELYDHPAFEIHQEFFTDADCVKYKHTPLLFISDIRSDRNKHNSELFEKDINFNMEQQKRWVLELKPLAASLKFRLPFTPGTTEYFNGDLYIQSYPPLYSAESRLFVEPPFKMRKYDHTEHEERMWHHNNVDRICYYKHNVDYPGLDYCYDCATQVQILQAYLKSVKRPAADIIGLLDDIDSIAKPLYRDHHGLKLTPNKCAANQKNRIDFIK